MHQIVLPSISKGAWCYWCSMHINRWFISVDFYLCHKSSRNQTKSHPYSNFIPFWHVSLLPFPWSTLRSFRIVSFTSQHWSPNVSEHGFGGAIVEYCLSTLKPFLIVVDTSWLVFSVKYCWLAIGKTSWILLYAQLRDWRSLVWSNFSLRALCLSNKHKNRHKLN